MADYKLIGKNYTTPDMLAKVTGRSKYAEDFRAEGMVFAKLLLSPMPHARVRRIDASAALAMPGVEGMLTADDIPEAAAPQEASLTNEPRYEGEPILAIAAVDEETAAAAVEAVREPGQGLLHGIITGVLDVSVAHDVAVEAALGHPVAPVLWCPVAFLVGDKE